MNFGRDGDCMISWQAKSRRVAADDRSRHDFTARGMTAPLIYRN
jgi:hypothetical protein